MSKRSVLILFLCVQSLLVKTKSRDRQEQEIRWDSLSFCVFDLSQAETDMVKMSDSLSFCVFYLSQAETDMVKMSDSLSFCVSCSHSWRSWKRRRTRTRKPCWPEAATRSRRHWPVWSRLDWVRATRRRPRRWYMWRNAVYGGLPASKGKIANYLHIITSFVSTWAPN